MNRFYSLSLFAFYFNSGLLTIFKQSTDEVSSFFSYVNIICEGSSLILKFSLAVQCTGRQANVSFEPLVTRSLHKKQSRQTLNNLLHTFTHYTQWNWPWLYWLRSCAALMPFDKLIWKNKKVSRSSNAEFYVSQTCVGFTCLGTCLNTGKYGHWHAVGTSSGFSRTFEEYRSLSDHGKNALFQTVH